MANAIAQATQPQVGGAPNRDLCRCNRCGGDGIWRGHPKPDGSTASGVCFACRGTGLLDRQRAERYLRGTGLTEEGLLQQPESDPAKEAMALALAAAAKGRAKGWAMQDPVQLADRTELLGRNPRRPGRTIHLTWVHAQRVRHIEWLDGPPSKHRDLLQP